MRDPLSERLGAATSRIDGVAKVTGAARYPSDEPVARAAFGYLVTSSIARGRIAAFDLTAAKSVGGVLQIFTHENFGGGFKPPQGPDGGATTTTLESDQIWHDGQIIAIVVADTYEAARESAHKVRVSYLPESPSATFDSPGVSVEAHKPQRGPDPKRGDAASAYAAAAVKFDATYSTPTQHHNPIELFTNTSVWEHGKLTVYEPSQYMVGLKAALATQLDVEPGNVRAISRFIGGAFGSKGPHPRSQWIARVAQRIGRPVKLVPTRDQGFTIATYRAETRHPDPLGRGFRWQARLAVARRVGGDVPAIGLQRVRYRDDGAHVRLPQHPDGSERGARRSQHAGLYAGPARNALYVRAGKRDG